MTRQQRARIRAFNELFDAIPADTNVERIRRVAEILHLQENTVRIYRLRVPTRVPTERNIALLRRALTT